MEQTKQLPSIESIVEPLVRGLVKPVTDSLEAKGYNVLGVTPRFLVSSEWMPDYDVMPGIIAEIYTESGEFSDVQKIQDMPELIPYNFKRETADWSPYAILQGLDPLSGRYVHIIMKVNEKTKALAKAEK